MFLHVVKKVVVCSMLAKLNVNQGSPSVMQHIVSVESSSLLLHSYLI